MQRLHILSERVFPFILHRPWVESEHVALANSLDLERPLTCSNLPEVLAQRDELQDFDTADTKPLELLGMLELCSVPFLCQIEVMGVKSGDHKVERRQAYAGAVDRLEDLGECFERDI